MVNPDNTVFLQDIADSCRKVIQFSKGMSYPQFAVDERTVSAVVRELSVIGEAARRVTDDFRTAHPQVPWEKIFGMRNRLVHEYMGVQLPIVWQTANEDIPQLKRIVEGILKSE